MTIPFSLIFLAGGQGSRMGAALPKQFLPLNGHSIALHSFELFLSLPEIQERVVVCDPKFQSIFTKIAHQTSLKFALPGKERQDSVFSGMQELKESGLVCIHDSARPFITATSVRNVVQAAQTYGSAALGVPVKATIKVCDGEQFVINTPSRSQLWEMQTPQVVRLDLLRQGFIKAKEGALTVTDDVSLSELLSHPVKIVMGSYSNIKITTPEDYLLAEHLVKNHVRL